MKNKPPGIEGTCFKRNRYVSIRPVIVLNDKARCHGNFLATNTNAIREFRIEVVEKFVNYQRYQLRR